jgi:hypothetical protein
MPKKIAIHCAMCGKRFEPARPLRAQYCSARCKVRSSRNRIRYQKWLAQETAKIEMIREAAKQETTMRKINERETIPNNP